MANYNSFDDWKAWMQTVIKENGVGGITGPLLQTVLGELSDTAEWLVSVSGSSADARALAAEGWAVGTRRGVPVTEGSPYYQNNSLYWSQQVMATAGDLAALVQQAQTAIRGADDSAADAGRAAMLAEGKAGEANDAANLAKEKAGLAEAAAGNANEKADFARQQGDYAKEQGDYARGEIDGAKGDYESLDARFDHIEEVDDAIRSLIPAQASEDNKLADKAYVNDKVSTDTATFRGTLNLVTDLELTTEATQGQIATALGTAISGEDKNDYAFVQIPTSDATPTEIARIDRYKYTGLQWTFEYSLNNSGFTAEQWAAINSGITSSLVTAFGAKYDKPAGGIPASDMNISTFDDEPTAGSANLVKSGGVYTEIQTINKKITNAFVDIDSAHFFKNGYISASGIYVESTAGKIYRYPLGRGKKCVIYSNAGSNSYAALSFSESENPSSFTMIMRYPGNSGGYYSYTAPSDGYIFITVETNAEGRIWMVNPQEPELNEFGVKKYTYGENAIQIYVGSDVSDTSLWGSGFLTSTGSITSGSGYHYSKEYIPVMQGTYLQAGIVMSGNARLCYYDAEKNFLSAVSGGHITESTKRTIPEGAAFMRFCTSNSDTTRLSFIYQNEGKQIVDVPEINALNSEVAIIKQTLSGGNKSIDNNLINESSKIDGWKVAVSTNGTNYTYDNLNYGQPNVRYVVPVDNSAKVLHVKFRFKFTHFLDGSSSAINQNLLTVGTTDSYRAALRQTLLSFNSDTYILQRRQFFVVQQLNNVSSVTLDNASFKQFEGEIAYSLEYKGTSYSSAVNYKLQLTSTAINVYDSDGTTVLETIPIDADELVSSVVDKVNNTSSYLKAVPYEVDGTKYTDCMYGSVKFPLCVSSSGSRPWMIAKMTDDKWHTFECVIDYNKLLSYSSIDGVTVIRSITEPADKTIYLGGAINSASYKMVPVQFTDLHIGYDYEDAEIITYPNNVSGSLTRLISNESPYLMIFEGHGIENKMNKDMPTGSDTYMNVSTDTLRTVFSALRSKGFVPVTWQEIVRWKKYGGSLPKRCYTLMFDDWRIDNYMNLDLRKPFVEFGVKPGLAVITGQNGVTRSRSEEVVIDNQTWTVGECFDAIIKGGWYPCSHTKDHTVLGNVNDMNLLPLLRECVYSCDKLGIYDDVLVYPTGSASSYKKYMMMVSGFAIGVKVAVNGFNCLASLDFDLTRNEIGSRKNINDILAQIV